MSEDNESPQIHHGSGSFAGKGDISTQADVVLWSKQQADLLRRLAHGEAVNVEVDWENIIEEIENLGASQRRSVRRGLELLCQHLLKWQYHQTHRSPSWQSTIIEQRRRLQGLFEDSPSLWPFAKSAFLAAFNNGRDDAARETRLKHLPDQCPWTLERIIDHDFWPDPTTRQGSCGRSTSIFLIFGRSNHREGSAVIERREGLIGMSQNEGVLCRPLVHNIRC